MERRYHRFRALYRCGTCSHFCEFKADTTKRTISRYKIYNPKARIVSVSTGGEIFDGKVHEESFVVSAMQFDSTKFEIIEKEVSEAQESYTAGQDVMQQLLNVGEVKYSLVFAGGTEVPGTALVEGLRSIANGKVPFSGGLAGDGMNFKATLLGVDGVPESGNKVIVVGFYGENIEIVGASIGGWDTFGMKQIVTKSEGSVVYELNNEPALDVYEKYLCELGAELPESGIIYPMSISSPESNVNPVIPLGSASRMKSI